MASLEKDSALLAGLATMLGLMHELSDKVTMGLAYTFLDAGSAPLTQTRGPLSGTVSGEYSSNYINIIALYVSAEF